MDQSAPRSLKHKYELFVEDEIENYKDSISRTVLLKIGDEAVSTLKASTQFAMNELLLCDEVNRIIRKRLRIPSYATWRKREIKRQKEQEEFRRPEHWGLRSDSVLAREVNLPAQSRVLTVGSDATSAAMYLAAQGCSVTAIQAAAENLTAALQLEAALLSGKVEVCPLKLNEWSPVEPLNAVVCTAAAFAGLTAQERAQVFDILKSATEDGGVHLVNTLAARHAQPSLSELKRRYKGWEISVVEDGTESRSFVARKAVA